MSWPLVPLGDHVEILSGFAFNSEQFGTSGDTPVVRIRDVVPGRSKTFFTGSIDSTYLVNNGDLLIGMDGNFNRGTWGGGPALLNQRVCRIAGISSSLDDRYLYHFLPQALQRIEDQTPFATVKHLSVKAIRSILIPLPPLPEQRRIASILDQADALRENRHAALAVLEASTSALFDEMVGRPSKNVSNYPTSRIDKVAHTRLGKMLDAAKQTGEFKKKYLRNTNVQWMRFELDSIAEMDFSVADQLEFSLRDGDVLVCEGGQPGRAAVWRSEIEDVYFQKALHRVRVDKSVLLPEVFVRTMRDLVTTGSLADSISSATIAHLTGEKLKAIEIPIPPMAVQNEYLHQARALDGLISLSQAHLAKLDELFASLQHRAFRGEL